jgi:hypothetical protein
MLKQFKKGIQSLEKSHNSNQSSTAAIMSVKKRIID